MDYQYPERRSYNITTIFSRGAQSSDGDRDKFC